VHSSLSAVDLTATFSATLAEAEISCNVVAGFYHDQISVAIEESMRAIEAIFNLAGH